MRISLCFLSSALLAVLYGRAYAHFALPVEAPIERLITNTQAYISEHPKDAHAYYTLGRIYYLAFVNKSYTVDQHGEKTPPNVAGGWLLGEHNYSTARRRRIAWQAKWQHATELIAQEMGYASPKQVPPEQLPQFRRQVSRKAKTLPDERWLPEVPKVRELVNYAAAAMRNFRKALVLDADNALYVLGYASLLEQYVDFLKERHVEEMPAAFRAFIVDEAKKLYYESYRLAIDRDLRHKERPLAGLHSLVGYEAANGYLRMAELNGIEDTEARRCASVRRNVEKLERLPFGAITPIIFSFETSDQLADLLEPDSSVRFDLDGDGRIERRPWVRPDTGILVWDPQSTGQIRSGRQLIGSVTWWIFFENGYQVLDALDDNRSGYLSGEELEGLAVWFDRDTDGVSDRGEVVPIAQTPVVWLATRATAWQGESPVNLQGLTLADGRVLATYDWMAKAIQDD